LITGKNVSSPSAKEIFPFDDGQKWFIDWGEAKFGEGWLKILIGTGHPADVHFLGDSSSRWKAGAMKFFDLCG
jgi:hypothetical protein